MTDIKPVNAWAVVGKDRVIHWNAIHPDQPTPNRLDFVDSIFEDRAPHAVIPVTIIPGHGGEDE